MKICTQMEEVKSCISQRLIHEFLGFVPTIILRMHANSLNPVTAAAAAMAAAAVAVVVVVVAAAAVVVVVVVVVVAAAAATAVVVDVRVGGGTRRPFPSG